MPIATHVRFVRDHKDRYFKGFIDKLRTAKDMGGWRCLNATLDPEIVKAPFQKKILKTFIESAFETTFDFIVFCFSTGHIFVFFQGPTRKIIKDFEILLNSLKSDRKKIEYHFFWELKGFWIFYDTFIDVKLGEKDEEGPEDNEFADLKLSDFDIDIQDPSEQDSGQQGDTDEKEDIREVNVFSEPYTLEPIGLEQRGRRYKPLMMIVEDDNTTRHMLQAATEKYGDISVAWDVEQAMNLYRKVIPSIVFLDIELPDGNGQDLVELFCQTDPEAFVVMVSGSLSQDRINRCLKAGAKGFIAKPASEARLLRFIHEYNKDRPQRISRA